MTAESAAPKLGKDAPDVIVRPYRFALKPTAAQERKLRQHTGAVRFAYNRLIAQWRDDLHTRAEEKECGVPEDELTPFTFKMSAYDMRNHWNHIKRECATWYSEVSKDIGDDA
ncbi:transposase, partial [Salmonella enterica subsp. enterica serovar Derby]